MHFLRLFLAFIQKLCIISFHFPKINKRGDWNKSGGGLENFSKINKRGGGRLFGTQEYVDGWLFYLDPIRHRRHKYPLQFKVRHHLIIRLSSPSFRSGPQPSSGTEDTKILCCSR